METRNKLGESEYFLNILPTVRNDPHAFRCNLSAFLGSWRSFLDVMLYDFNEFYTLGFTREVAMNAKDFEAVAKKLRNRDAERFIQWWREKQGMLKNSPLWEKRNISIHRGGPTIQRYRVVVTGSGGNSSTISPDVLAVLLPDDSALKGLVPQMTTEIANVIQEWYFDDFPNMPIVQICRTAYEQCSAIVEEAEREFNVRL